MPKLYFRYGTMNSSKTANLLMVAHNYRTQGKTAILIKPQIDTRNGLETIKSRAFSHKVDVDIILNSDMNEIKIAEHVVPDCILVDEAQFLSVENVNALRNLPYDIPIICYGLRTDYRSKLFEGAKRLMEIADSIEEIKTVCVHCNKKAIVNAKFYIDSQSGEKVILHDGSDKIDLGAEEKYIPLCWNCWKV